jgi:hypothetical protein
MSVAAVVLALTGPAGAQAGNPPMDPKLVAMLEKVRQMLPDYEKLCDESDKTIREMRSLATPLSANAVQALQEAQLRIEVIRSIRQLIARSPRTLAGPGGLSVDATTMLPVWKEGIVYYLDCAKAGKDPFQCATAGIRTVKSRMDGELLFYRFSVPNAYDKARKYPADIHLHCSKALVWRATWVDGKPSFDAKDANFGQNNQAVWPNEGFMFSASGRGEGQYQVIAEAAVMEIVADIKKNYSVDEDRIVSGGDSMGGLGGFRIGTLHPDQFAAVRSLSGSAVVPVNSYYSANLLLDNLCNIGMGLMDAGKDPNSKLTAVSIAEIKALQQKYPGCYPMHTVYDAEAVHGCVAAPLCQETYAWMRTQKRNLWPKTVIYKTYCLRYDGAYWAHIDMVDDPTKPARIEAQVQDGGKIRVVADNIQRLRLNLAKELVGDLKTVAVAIDGQEPLTVPAGGEIFFARDGGKWAISSERLPTGLAKSHGMSGPVADAFMENPVLWVYGASEGQDSKANQDIDKIVNYWFGPGEGYIAFHTDFERKADKDVTDADIADKNLILVGAPKQNALLARLADRLPVKFLDNGVEVGGKRYAEAGTSILMIYPNPLNPKRYILLMPAWLADSNGLSHGDYDNTLYQFGDYVVCKLGPTGENGTNVLTPIVQGSFDSRWQLPTSANRQATRQQTSPACTASILP